MDQAKRLAWRDASLSDLAVDGVLAGLGAGFVTAIVLGLVGVVSGDTPTGVFARFDAGVPPQPLSGALTHLAVSGVYGLGFGVTWWLVGRRLAGTRSAILLGLFYAGLLYLFAEAVLLPSLAPALLTLPTWGFALAHVVFGLTLGWLLSWQARGRD